MILYLKEKKKKKNEKLFDSVLYKHTFTGLSIEGTRIYFSILVKNEISSEERRFYRTEGK